MGAGAGGGTSARLFPLSLCREGGAAPLMGLPEDAEVGPSTGIAELRDGAALWGGGGVRYSSGAMRGSSDMTWS